MFLDGLEEVWVRVEQLLLVLPVVAGRNEQTAVLWQHRLHPPQPRKQVGHLETERLQTANSGADKGQRRSRQMEELILQSSQAPKKKEGQETYNVINFSVSKMSWILTDFIKFSSFPFYQNTHQELGTVQLLNNQRGATRARPLSS